MAEAASENAVHGRGERVNFKVEDGSTSSPVTKHRATVRYNRKAVQKMLAIDDWIGSQLEVLYSCSSDDVPVELSVDDVAEKEEGPERAEFVRSTLDGCPAETAAIDAFIQNLLDRLKKV